MQITQTSEQTAAGVASIVCPNCKTENKIKARNCKKCGWDLSMPAVWIPTWKWHLKVLGIIYTVLVVGYFVANALLKQLPPPYNLRNIPKEVTPWLK